MRALFDFLARYNHWLLFLLLEVVSFVLLFQFNRYQSSVWLTTANVVVGKATEWESQAISYLTLGSVNEQLTRRNLMLQQHNAELTRQLAELTHDSTRAERLQTQRLDGIDLLPAKVVTNSVMRRNNLMTVSAGALDGVEPEMGVVCGTGIVGIVSLTSDHYSIVTPLLNSHSTISCRLRRTGYTGFLRWDGANPLYCVLEDIPLHAKSRVGDVVETSGYSSIFPEGLFVGRVSAIETSDDGLSYQLRVHLGMDFAQLRDVSIVRKRFQQELRNLEAKADSLNSEAQ